MSLPISKLSFYLFVSFYNITQNFLDNILCLLAYKLASVSMKINVFTMKWSSVIAKKGKIVPNSVFTRFPILVV